MELSRSCRQYAATRDYRNGLKGKRFGHLGAASGHLGKSYGGIRRGGGQHNKREQFSLFKKLHIIEYARTHGFAMAIVMFWGVIDSKAMRVIKKKMIKSWMLKEKELVAESMKIRGLDRKRIHRNGSCTWFTRSEEKVIYDLFRDCFDRNVPVNSQDVIAWALQVAQKVGKLRGFKAGWGFMRGFMDRWNLSFQVQSQSPLSFTK